MTNSIAKLNVVSSSKDALKKSKFYRNKYLDNEAIIVENSGIDFDSEFLYRVKFIDSMKKIGTQNGITNVLFC